MNLTTVRNLLTSFSAFFLAIFGFLGISQAQANYIVARAPQLSPSVLAEIWTPYLEYLSRETGHKFTLKLYTERRKFESDIVKQKVDFYFGNPAYAVVGYLKHKYIPIVRGDKKRLKGIIVVREDNPINSIEDLRNKQIVFPGRTAFAASLYIQDQLENHLNLPYKAEYVDTHDNAYRSVLSGKFNASGGVRRTLERENKSIKEKLRIVYETPGVKPHVLMVHPRVPKEVTTQVVDTTLNLNNTSSGKRMLKKLKMEIPIQANYQEDYKNLEPLTRKVYDYLLD